MSDSRAAAPVQCMYVWPKVMVDGDSIVMSNGPLSVCVIAGCTTNLSAVQPTSRCFVTLFFSIIRTMLRVQTLQGLLLQQQLQVGV